MNGLQTVLRRYAVLLAIVSLVPASSANAQAKGADGKTRYKACYIAEKRAYSAAAPNKSCYRRCGDCKKSGKTWNCRAAYKYDRQSCGSGFISADPDRKPFSGAPEWLQRYYPGVSYADAFGSGGEKKKPRSLPWVSADFTVVKTTPDRLAFIIENPGGGKTSTRVLIEAYDTFSRKWVAAFVDVKIDLRPNERYPSEQATNDKACYRVRTENMTATGWKPGLSRTYPANCRYGSPPW
jgi:hypothetical protein